MINSTVVSNTIQPAYSKKLLLKAVQLTKITQFAQQEELPPGNGNMSIRFFRPESANMTASGAPAALTEGTPISTPRVITYTPIDVTLAQRGQFSKVSDIANTVSLVKHLDNTIDLQAEEFSLDVEQISRNPLAHPTTGLTKRYAAGMANFAAVAAAAASAAVVTPRDLLDGMTALKIARAPKFGESYAFYTCPQVTRDMLNNAEWRDVVKTGYAEKLFKGEIGDYFGCRIVEGTAPFQEDETEGTFASTFVNTGTNTTGFVYTSFLMGKGSFGTVNMKKAGSSLLKPSVIINDKSDKSDPLNQFITVGWKAYWAATVLNPAWGIALRTKSQFV